MIFTNRNFDIFKADIYCNIFYKISEFHFKIKYLYNYKKQLFRFYKVILFNISLSLQVRKNFPVLSYTYR